MTRHLSTSIVCGLAAVVTLGLAGTANAQQTTDSTANRSRAKVTSTRRIPVRKDAVTTESAGAVAPAPNADSVAAAARADSIANAERMRADSIARADSLRAWNLAHMRRAGWGPYFQIAAGTSMPQSDFKSGFDNGFDVTGSVGYHPWTSPIGIRFDVAYDRFGAKSAVAGSSDNLSVWSGLADLTLRVPKMWAVSPYLIGGGGVSRFSDYGGSGSSTKGQWNAGGGIGFGLGNVKLFVESRYMHVATPGTATKYVPVVLGISL